VAEATLACGPCARKSRLWASATSRIKTPLAFCRVLETRYSLFLVLSFFFLVHCSVLVLCLVDWIAFGFFHLVRCSLVLRPYSSFWLSIFDLIAFGFFFLFGSFLVF